ncbi:hypothetical protein GCM10027589_26200 [Actinocorallia lasiicapitis]
MAAVVLQLASDLNLLGLCSASPHWLDPLDGQGFYWPHRYAYRIRADTSEPCVSYGYNRTRFTRGSVRVYAVAPRLAVVLLSVVGFDYRPDLGL